PGIFVDETNAATDALYLLEGRAASPFATGWYETPNGYIYYMAGLFKLLGANFLSLKLASLIPAILTVPAVFLLARELFGPTVGLTAMFLLAVNRWHMTMSRWAWNETAPPLFLTLSAYFLLRGLRTRRALDYAVGGLLGGAMLYTYLSSRLAAATLALFLLVWVLADPDGPVQGWRRTWRGGLLYALAALIVAAPLLVTYASDSFAFLNRSLQISVFNDVREAGGYAPLWANVADYARMFFDQGDMNGRHNLPGAPMLDPITALFFAVGLAYSLFRLRDRRRHLLLLWVLLNLAGGILSERATAPNAYRTLNVVVAVVILAGDALVRSGWGMVKGRLGDWEIGGLERRGVGSVVGALLLVAGAVNVYTYFGPQARSPHVQSSFNFAETATAQDVLAALDRGETVYLTPRMYHFS
ncbi:MAG: hypothetical protein D6790_01605, partial [Caldilineae bacterium]